jgi:hypothetical protein
MDLGFGLLKSIDHLPDIPDSDRNPIMLLNYNLLEVLEIRSSTEGPDHVIPFLPLEASSWKVLMARLYGF